MCKEGELFVNQVNKWVLSVVVYKSDLALLSVPYWIDAEGDYNHNTLSTPMIHRSLPHIS